MRRDEGWSMHGADENKQEKKKDSGRELKANGFRERLKKKVLERVIRVPKGSFRVISWGLV